MRGNQGQTEGSYRTLTRACVTLLAASFHWPVLVDTLRTVGWKQPTKLTERFTLTIIQRLIGQQETLLVLVENDHGGADSPMQYRLSNT